MLCGQAQAHLHCRQALGICVASQQGLRSRCASKFVILVPNFAALHADQPADWEAG